MAGTFPHNFHEGSRSEYLAQYALTALGTVAAVPHHEDTGIDLHSTILEKRGPTSFPVKYYTVQVKSDVDTWKLKSPEEIEWLINLPLPVFLCVVVKKEGRVLIYPMITRYDVARQKNRPEELTIILGRNSSNSNMQYDTQNRTITVRAPILDFQIQNMYASGWKENTKKVIQSWISFEEENAQYCGLGIHAFKTPISYQSNNPVGQFSLLDSGFPPDGMNKKRITELLNWLLAFTARYGSSEAALLGIQFARAICSEVSDFKPIYTDIAFRNFVKTKRSLTETEIDELEKLALNLVSTAIRELREWKALADYARQKQQNSSTHPPS